MWKVRDWQEYVPLFQRLKSHQVDPNSDLNQVSLERKKQQYIWWVLPELHLGQVLC